MNLVFSFYLMYYNTLKEFVIIKTYHISKLSSCSLMIITAFFINGVFRNKDPPYSFKEINE